MVYDLHRDAPGLRFGEGPGGVAVKAGPGVFVDFSLKGGLERLVGIVRPQEVGVADEETFLVIVGVDEPAGDPLSTVAADLAGVRVEHVHAVDLDLDLIVGGVKDVDIRLAEDDEQIPLAGVLEIVGHVQVSVHPGLEHGDSTEFVEFRRMGVIVEGAGDEDVKTGVTGLTGGMNQVGAGNGAEFGTDEDGGPFLDSGAVAFFQVAPFGTDQVARPGDEGGEGDLVFLVGLLYPGCLEVFQNHLGEISLLAVPFFRFRRSIDEFIISADGQHPVRG